MFYLFWFTKRLQLRAPCRREHTSLSHSPLIVTNVSLYPFKGTMYMKMLKLVPLMPENFHEKYYVDILVNYE